MRPCCVPLLPTYDVERQEPAVGQSALGSGGPPPKTPPPKFRAPTLGLRRRGLTITMELAASLVAFLYVPLLNHFEQQLHVRHRLERHRAGTAVDYADATPESPAASMVTAISAPVDYAAVPTGGAFRATNQLVQLLG